MHGDFDRATVSAPLRHWMRFPDIGRDRTGGYCSSILVHSLTLTFLQSVNVELGDRQKDSDRKRP
jgi:hypothetical protein